MEVQWWAAALNWKTVCLHALLIDLVTLIDLWLGTWVDSVITGEQQSSNHWILDLFDRMPWRRHAMETFSVLLAPCEGNPSVAKGFPSQKVSNMSFPVSFDISPTKLLNKQGSWRWFETAKCWFQCNNVLGFVHSTLTWQRCMPLRACVGTAKTWQQISHSKFLSHSRNNVKQHLID